MLARHLEGTDETAMEFIRFVSDGAAHMDQLIESLLRYAESGEQLSLQHVNVNAVVDGLLRRLEPLVRESGATITRDLLPEVEADPVRLLQVFQNLLVNAINYRGSEQPRIQISAVALGSEFRFEVADNGIGIGREHFELIFAPLKRLESKKVRGSGLGLALCRKIVEMHGGRMWLESIVGKGSRFFFTLPNAAENERREQTKPH
jgi:light-regulated signal transduction histidine kinase (bacteriophytochrome)